jgi:hypothetical protein
MAARCYSFVVLGFFPGKENGFQEITFTIRSNECRTGSGRRKRNGKIIFNLKKS